MNDRRQTERRQNGGAGGLRRGDRRQWVGTLAERRSLARLEMKMPVMVSSSEGDAVFRQATIDVSEGGLRIISPKEFPLYSELELCLYPPELFIPIQATARVQWRKYDMKSRSYIHGLVINDIGSDYYLTFKNYLDRTMLDAKHALTTVKKRVRQAFYENVIGTLIRNSYVSARALSGHAASGVSFDHIYVNKPKGATLLGRLADKMILNLPAARASRNRKELIQRAVNQEIKRNIALGRFTKVADVACGTSRYLIESIGPDKIPHVQAVCLDRDPEAITAGRDLAGSRPFRFVRFDIFKAGRLRALSDKLAWKPNLVIVSGFIYYLTDRQVQHLVRQIYEWLQPDGLLIVTNMVNNPNRSLIGRLFTTHQGDPWIPLARQSRLVRGWLATSGFENIQYANEPYGMYSIFSARKSAEPIRSRQFELSVGKTVLKGRYCCPTRTRALKGNVVFVHGLGYSHQAYKLDPKAFTNAGFGLCVYNMMAHGTSGGEWTFDGAVNDLKKVISQVHSMVQGRQPVYVFAHSTGALIAFLAVADNFQVRAISAVNVVTCITDSFLHWHKSGYNEKVRDLCRLNNHLPSVIKEWLDDPRAMVEFMKNKRSWDELDFTCRYGLMKADTFRHLANAICFSPDLLKLGAIRKPVLLFTGQDDEVISVDHTRELYQLVTGPKKMIKTESTDHFQKDCWDQIQNETIQFFLTGAQES